MNREIVDKTGATYMLMMMLLAKVFTSNPRMLALKAGTSSWLVTLLAAMVAWPGFLALSALLRRFPQKSLGQISKEVLGPVAGVLACLIYCGYFVYLSGLFMRQFEASFRIAILPRTPASALLISFAIAVSYVCYRGVEAICRISSYLFPILFGLIVLVALGTVRLADFRYLLPFFGEGVATTFLLPFPESSVYSEVLALGALAGMLRVSELHRIGARALWWSALVMAGGIALMGGVFPYPALARLHFPMLDLARAIQAGEFLQRVEALFVVLWFFFGSLKVSAALACAALFFRDAAGLADYRPLVFALTLIAYTIAFLPDNTLAVMLLDSYSLRTWTWPISYVMPALTLAAALWRARREVPTHAASG